MGDDEVELHAERGNVGRRPAQQADEGAVEAGVGAVENGVGGALRGGDGGFGGTEAGEGCLPLHVIQGLTRNLPAFASGRTG